MTNVKYMTVLLAWDKFRHPLSSAAAFGVSLAGPRAQLSSCGAGRAAPQGLSCLAC
jgi:hypothetical protein